MLAKTSVKTFAERAPEEITKDIYKTFEIVIEQTWTPLSEIGGIGMGIPGCFNNDTGVVIETNNVNLSDFSLFLEPKRYIDKPMMMANDANCATLGESSYGAVKGYNDVVMLTILR